ncbi:hypothetical protein [Sinomonas halotolerans]|uniref:Uncharacterized protein n=1 Tax=Sinomonas halotolerans TaxID=1644133 RepID=A0ABU9X590_9MICC
MPLGAEALNLALAVPDLPAALILAAAGAGEGAVLGAVQAWQLGIALPGLRRGRFIALTAAAASVAWALGMLPSTTWEAWTAWPLPAVIGGGAVLGAALLASIGTGQWLELRRLVPHAWTWIVATAAAWCAGLGAFFAVATPLWTEGQPLWLVLAIGALGAAAMAVSMAAVTGWAARWLVHGGAKDFTTGRQGPHNGAAGTPQRRVGP